MIKSRSPLNVLILGRLRQYSGNSSTANRIRQYFEENGFYCVAKDVDQYHEKEEFIKYLHNDEIQVIIGIHAFIAGSLLKDCPLPYSIIFGGTDLNEYSKDAEKMEVMNETVQNAKSLIGFSKPMINKAERLWPSVEKEKLVTIPQGVRTTPAVHPLVNLQKQYDVEPDGIIFTLVAGIRPVKDPLQLIPNFTDWHQLGNRKVFLVIVGPKIDREYSQYFDEVIDGCPGIIYVGSQTSYDTHAIIKESFALINCSVSEGMALSILEAMDLGVPVIARNIPGNAALIEHGVTGLLYSGPEDFITKADQLIKDETLRRSIIENAKAKLAEEHSCKAEKSRYVEIATALKTDFNPNWYEDLTKVEEETDENEEEVDTEQTLPGGKENLPDKTSKKADGAGIKSVSKGARQRKLVEQTSKETKKSSKASKMPIEQHSDLNRKLSSKKKTISASSEEQTLSKSKNSQGNKHPTTSVPKASSSTSQRKILSPPKAN